MHKNKTKFNHKLSHSKTAIFSNQNQERKFATYLKLNQTKHKIPNSNNNPIHKSAKFSRKRNKNTNFLVHDQQYYKKKKRKLTRQLPRLAFTDINFTNNRDIFFIPIDLQPQVVVDQLLVSWTESEPQWQRIHRNHSLSHRKNSHTHTNRETERHRQSLEEKEKERPFWRERDPFG